MPSGTVDRRLASFCTSRLRAVRMQAKSDRNYPVLPYCNSRSLFVLSLSHKSHTSVGLSARNLGYVYALPSRSFAAARTAEARLPTNDGSYTSYW